MVFSETPVAGSVFPDPAADGDSDDEVTIKLKAPGNPSSVGLPTLFDFAGSNKRIENRRSTGLVVVVHTA
jgi:hypothetical protein